MSSKYDSIKTAAELVAEIQRNGMSMSQEDICRAQDIFGNAPIDELVRLANDIGRDNEKGEPDPKGTWGGGCKATRGTFYAIITNIWNWEEVTRFWNLYTNPQTEELKDLKRSYVLLKKEESQKSDEAAKEHKMRLEETAEKLKLKDEAEKLRANLHARDMEVMELKAKLYDLLVEGKVGDAR